MKYFLWKIAGGDCELLNKSGRESQFSYSVIGILFLLVNFVTYLAFFGLFWGVFHNPVFAVLGSLVLGFLITNIYRLNLLSLEPNTLPVIQTAGSIVGANLVRFITVILFAFFISKCLETTMFGYLVDDEITQRFKISRFEGSRMYIQHMLALNKSCPEIWFFTLVNMCLFLSPVYLKYRLNKGREYFLYKRIRDKELVKNEFAFFTNLKDDIYAQLYAKKDGNYLYVPPQSPYSDAPFNSIRRSSPEIKLKSTSDFVNLPYWNKELNEN